MFGKLRAVMTVVSPEWLQELLSYKESPVPGAHNEVACTELHRSACGKTEAVSLPSVSVVLLSWSHWDVDLTRAGILVFAFTAAIPAPRTVPRTQQVPMCAQGKNQATR